MKLLRISSVLTIRKGEVIMKRIIYLIAAVFAFTPVWADDAGDKKESSKNASEDIKISDLDLHTRIQLMKQFDKNGDGRLDEQERAEAKKAINEKRADLQQMRKKFAKDIIAKFDKDGDGKLDETELMAFMEEQRKAFESDRQNRRPRKEFAPSKEMLAKFDKDGDGKISRQERRAMFEQAHKKREALLKKYDEDGDGKLSEAEKTKLIQDPEVQNMMKRMISNPPPPPPPAQD